MTNIKTSEIQSVRGIFLKHQNYMCAICCTKINAGEGCLDHNHKTGVIRGVLCRNCNGIEGKINNLANRGKRQYSELWFLNRLSQYWDKHLKYSTDMIHPTYKTPDEKRIKRNLVAKRKRATTK